MPARDKSEMSTGEVADLAQVDPKTVLRWEEKGLLVPDRRLPGSRYRRYKRASVEAFLRGEGGTEEVN